MLKELSRGCFLWAWFATEYKGSSRINPSLNQIHMIIIYETSLRSSWDAYKHLARTDLFDVVFLPLGPF